MRMRGKKPIFSYKDTWNLDTTLRPIIAEGVKAFLNASRASSFGGIPCGFSGYDENDYKGSKERWHKCLEQIVWAFESKPPEPEDFGITFKHSFKEPDEHGLIPFHIEVNSEELYDQYLKAEEEYYKKRQEGYDMFAKNLSYMWW